MTARGPGLSTTTGGWKVQQKKRKKNQLTSAGTGRHAIGLCGTGKSQPWQPFPTLASDMGTIGYAENIIGTPGLPPGELSSGGCLPPPPPLLPFPPLPLLPELPGELGGWPCGQGCP
jgi:hypothetical protein